MADMAQIELALDRLGVRAGSRLLEFGCGDGQVAAYIAASRGAAVHGLDIAARAVELARLRAAADARLAFTCADILADPRALPPGPFDAALAVDSFFFVPDQRTALERILARLAAGGRFGAFLIAPEPAEVEDLPLARAARDLGRPVEAVDLTADNRRHWETKKAVLAELRDDFYAEGNEFLYLNRSAEGQGWETMRRWLVICT